MGGGSDVVWPFVALTFHGNLGDSSRRPGFVWLDGHLRNCRRILFVHKSVCLNDVRPIKRAYPMKSKALVVFQNRSKHFEADLELADLLASAVAGGALSSNRFVFEHCDPEKHPVLAKRKRTHDSRNTAIRHLSATLKASYIKDLYEDFCAYLTAIIRSAAAKGLDSDRLIGDHPFSIEARDLLALKNWDMLLDRLSRDLFRKIEEMRDTMKTIRAFCRKLGLDVDQQLLESAEAYFEMRHLLVHADGQIDKAFVKKFPAFGWKLGDYMGLTTSVTTQARQAVSKLVLAIDAEVIAKKVVREQDTQP